MLSQQKCTWTQIMLSQTNRHWAKTISLADVIPPEITYYLLSRTLNSTHSVISAEEKERTSLKDDHVLQ